MKTDTDRSQDLVSLRGRIVVVVFTLAVTGCGMRTPLLGNTGSHTAGTGGGASGLHPGTGGSLGGNRDASTDLGNRDTGTDLGTRDVGTDLVNQADGGLDSRVDGITDGGRDLGNDLGVQRESRPETAPDSEAGDASQSDGNVKDGSAGSDGNPGDRSDGNARDGRDGAYADGIDAGRDVPTDSSQRDGADGSLDVRPESGPADLGGASEVAGRPQLSLLAGTLGGPGAQDGTGAAAQFYFPSGLVSDGAGNLFVADSGNNTIRKIILATGATTTLAGSPGISGTADGVGGAAQFLSPQGVALDGAGNLFVADSANNTIRKVVIATATVTTVAGSAGRSGTDDGTGMSARFNLPQGVASDGAGNLFVADSGNHTIRKLALATGAVTTFAGSAGIAGSSDGIGSGARFNFPQRVTSDGAGNLFVADAGNQTIRRVVLATGDVSTLAGLAGNAGSSDGIGSAARFDEPQAVVSDGAGNLLVADRTNSTIRAIVVATGAVTTLAGSVGLAGDVNGIGSAALFNGLGDVACDGAGNLFVADTDNHEIRKVVIATREVATLAGSGQISGSSDGMGQSVRFLSPQGLASDGAGNLFVADSGNHTIRKLVFATGEVSTLAGSAGTVGNDDGTGAGARFNSPEGLAYDGTGNLLVADTANHTIRRVVLATGAVTTLAGRAGVPGSADGTGSSARFDAPVALASDGASNLYVADSANHTIRKVGLADGAVTTLAGLAGSPGSDDGTGSTARFTTPFGVACDGAGVLFVADTGNSAIRMVVLSTAAVTTLAGLAGSSGNYDGMGSAARFSTPGAMAYASTGDLFVADSDKNTIRKIHIPTQFVTTVVGSPGRWEVILGPLPAEIASPAGLALAPSGDLVIADQHENALLLAHF